MGRKEENVHFTCVKCFKEVLPLQNGSYRNHCPFCLTSIHVDVIPGDRKSLCRGLMVAFKLIYKGNKGWQMIHKCEKCGLKKANRIADGNIQPDNWDMILKLSQQ